MGFPCFRELQLAVDTTLVSVLRRDGVLRQHSTTHDGVRPPSEGAGSTQSLQARGAAHGLWSWPGEVGGRWSEECREFLNQLAKAKARREPPHLRARARQVWRHRWASLLVCSAAKAFALSPAGAQERSGFPMVTLHSPLR